MPTSLRHRIAGAAPAILGGIVLIVVLWLTPDLTPQEAVPVVGQRTDHARIIEARGTDATGLPHFEVELIETGERLEAVVQETGAAPGTVIATRYSTGDEVAVTRFTAQGDESFAVISDPWRLSTLGLAALLFAIAVMVVGGLRGARALIALALTLAVVLKLVVPLLLRGFDPILLAVGGAALVTLVTLLLTEGPSRISLSALVGTLIALAATAGLAALFTGFAEFTQLQGNEEVAFLIPLIGQRVDLQGILLAATVFGALGVLDDVTVTQAAAVEQLHRARPDASRRSVLGHAMVVGRSHIAATVNTLVLAYLGAGLPLLLLSALSSQAPLTVLNSEIVAVEVIRALVGSIGIVAAVPITTLVATWLIVPSPMATIVGSSA
jgi:uncharacterized membrane protein